MSYLSRLIMLHVESIPSAPCVFVFTLSAQECACALDMKGLAENRLNDTFVSRKFADLTQFGHTSRLTSKESADLRRDNATSQLCEYSAPDAICFLCQMLENYQMLVM